MFVYSNGTFPEVYPKYSNKSMQEAEMLQEFYNDLGISYKLKSDRAPEFCGRESSYLILSQGKKINLTYAE